MTGANDRHILVVDDDHDSASIVQRVLARQGFAVEVAHDGIQALACLAARRPDLLLLDIMMPGMSGIDVLSQVRNDPRLTTLPVILVTAKAQASDLIEGYQTGADYYINKPFTPDQLLYGVTLLLGGKRA